MIDACDEAAFSFAFWGILRYLRLIMIVPHLVCESLPVSVTASCHPSKSAVDTAALPSLHLSVWLSLSYLGQLNGK